MDVNYILIKGNKHFKCHSLAEMAIYFSLSVTSNGSVICDGYHDTMSYSKEWSHEDIITDFIRNSVPSAKEIKEAIKDGFPNGTTYKLLVPTSVCINQ